MDDLSDVLTPVLTSPGPGDAAELLPVAIPRLLAVLTKGESHQGEWRRLTAEQHREHAAEHFLQAYHGNNPIDDDGEPHIWHGICRMIMAAHVEALADTNRPPK